MTDETREQQLAEISDNLSKAFRSLDEPRFDRAIRRLNELAKHFPSPAPKELPEVAGRKPVISVNIDGQFVIEADERHEHEECLLADGRWADNHEPLPGPYFQARTLAAALAFLQECAAKEASAPQTVGCPECGGSGKSNMIPLFVKPVEGHKPTDGELRSLAESLSVCSFCDGACKVKPERLEWLAIGEQWRKARKHFRLGMREWAEKIGCLPSDYCDMEHGRIRPDERFSPLVLGIGIVPAHAPQTTAVPQGELTIAEAQRQQPWTVPYSKAVLNSGVPHILASHCVLHAAKTLGKLAAVFESLDHTGSEQPSREQRRVIVEMSADLMTEALRFANIYKFDLETALRMRVREKNGVGYASAAPAVREGESQ